MWTQLNSLSQLRGLELVLWPGSDVRAGAFSGLQHLTRLTLDSHGEDGRSIEPAALAGLRQLQHLQLSLGCTGEEEGAAALLQQLAQLKQLTCLTIRFGLRQATSPAAYSALTASSGLQRLGLTGCELPEGAWQHVFSAERQRSALQELHLELTFVHSQGDVESMVAACPKLRRLMLEFIQGDAMEAEPRAMVQLLTPLSGLSQLSALTVTNVADASVASVVAQLSGLRSLDLTDYVATPVAGLLPLTQLRHLTHLMFLVPDTHGPGGPEHSVDRMLDNEAPEGSPPDVWRQVLEHCKLQNEDLAVRHAAWQAAANEAQLEQLRQRLDAQEQQLATLQQQVAALTQRRQP